MFLFEAIFQVASLPPWLPARMFGIVVPINLGGSWTTDILSGVIAIANMNANMTEVLVVVLVLPKEVALGLPTKPAFMPEFDWVVDCKLAESPEFGCPPPAQRGAIMTFEFVPPMLTPMAATGVPPGDVVIALTSAAAAAATGFLLGDVAMALTFKVTATAAAASTFGGGGVGVCDIVALLGESWV